MRERKKPTQSWIEKSKNEIMHEEELLAKRIELLNDVRIKKMLTDKEIERDMEEIKALHLPKPIGYLRHEPTHITITVYHKIPRFHKYWLKMCFGLTYRNANDNELGEKEDRN